MKEYRKKWHIEYMASDLKPKGAILKKIEGSNRMRAKQYIRQEIENLSENHDNYPAAHEK